MKIVNSRLNILQAQYDAMRIRPDADKRVLNRYEELIEAEYRKAGQATSLNSRLAKIRHRRAAAA